MKTKITSIITLIIVLLTIFVINTPAVSANDNNSSGVYVESVSSVNSKKTESNLDDSLEKAITRRGCCSSHNGVCRCESGHSICCDGWTGSSCQSFKDDIPNDNLVNCNQGTNNKVQVEPIIGKLS